MILSECIRDIFDHFHYLENNWKLGQPHHVPMATIQNPNIPPEPEED